MPVFLYCGENVVFLFYTPCSFSLCTLIVVITPGNHLQPFISLIYSNNVKATYIIQVLSAYISLLLTKVLQELHVLWLYFCQVSQKCVISFAIDCTVLSGALKLSLFCFIVHYLLHEYKCMISKQVITFVYTF